MNCHYCGVALKGLADARLVNEVTHFTPGGKDKTGRVAACRDVDACNARVSEREAERVEE